jgi:hypothetical protein
LSANGKALKKPLRIALIKKPPTAGRLKTGLLAP